GWLGRLRRDAVRAGRGRYTRAQATRASLPSFALSRTLHSPGQGSRTTSRCDADVAPSCFFFSSSVLPQPRRPCHRRSVNRSPSGMQTLALTATNQYKEVQFAGRLRGRTLDDVDAGLKRELEAKVYAGER